MSHYDTLGVPADASTNDIKKAYRKKASAAHPDRAGGSSELMTAVNQAYETLGNPDRRARYDATGEDSPQVSVEKRAVGMLIKAFDMHLDSPGDLVKKVRDMLASGKSQARDEIASLKVKNDRLAKRREKVKVNSGENLVHMLIDGQIAGNQQQSAMLQDAIDVTTEAEKILAAYEYQPDESDQQRPKGMVDLDAELMAMLRGSKFGVPPGDSPFNFTSEFRPGGRI